MQPVLESLHLTNQLLHVSRDIPDRTHMEAAVMPRVKVHIKKTHDRACHAVKTGCADQQ